MKLFIPCLSFFACSCTQHIIASDVPTNQLEQKIYAPSEKASNLIQKLHAQDYKAWKADIQIMKDTYARVVKVLDDKESIQFTIAFFKALSLSEDIDQQIWNLSNNPNELPNTNTLKFLYKTEKLLDEMVGLLEPFTKSRNQEIQSCAIETGKSFLYQKDLFTEVRSVDYRTFKTSDMPQRIPPEVLRAHARFLEQRDQMTQSIVSFYAKFAETPHSN